MLSSSCLVYTEYKYSGGFMKKLVLSVGSFFAMFIFVGANAAALAQYQSGSSGVDVSYPNCSSAISKVSFGVVGTEGGLGFSQNPCLSAEAARFTNLSLYANTGYPGAASANAQKYANSPKICVASDLNCIAYNYGYNQGLYAYNYAVSQNARSATWWLDVETANSWTTDVLQNQNSLQGEHDALAANGATTVGVYSTSAQWNSITGTWKNGWANWGATSWTSATQAQTYCTGHEFTGGQSLLMQFKSKRASIDQDVAC